MRMTSTILLLLLILSGVSYGAVSEDVYVRKDVFEVKMEAFMGEIRLMNEQLRSDIRRLEARVDGVNATLSGRIDGLDKRIDDLRNGIYLWLVAIGLIVAWPKARELLQRLGKSAPSLTLEDVRRLIEENNAMLEKKFQA